MQDLTGTGFSITITATNTYPNGFICTSFADEIDPLDFSEQQITQYKMGLNGDLITWKSVVPIELTISIIPGTVEETYLDFLFEANRIAKGKKSSNDVITFIVNYADGRRRVLTSGKIVSGTPGNGISSNGRIKIKTYKFVFENII